MPGIQACMREVTVLKREATQGSLGEVSTTFTPMSVIRAAVFHKRTSAMSEESIKHNVAEYSVITDAVGFDPELHRLQVGDQILIITSVINAHRTLIEAKAVA